jgi:hypothetical protein
MIQKRPALPGIGPQLPPGPTTTILLPALEWNYTFPSIIQSPYPSLPELLDALIEKLLDDPLTGRTIWDHLTVLLAYLYGYVSALRDRSFAEHLKYEHRQYHYDSSSGMSTGTLPFTRHERKIRDALREGRFQLCDCSADEEDESLFLTKTIARIRILMGLPSEPGDYEAAKKEALEDELREYEREKNERRCSD